MQNYSRRIAASLAVATLITPLMTIAAHAGSPDLQIRAGLGGFAWGRGHGKGIDRGKAPWKSTQQDAQRKGPVAFGTVSAVSGNTVTLSTKPYGASGPSVTFTVDAASATFAKKDGTATLADIKVGSEIKVEGTLTGSTITATKIMLMAAKAEPSKIEGTGQPVVSGKVKAVSGSTITLASLKGNLTYTVNASSAKFANGGKASALADIAVGDVVLVQGAVSGSSITASSVIEKPGFFGHIWATLFGGL